jgi:outer membrane protein assembly factor BamB
MTGLSLVARPLPPSIERDVSPLRAVLDLLSGGATGARAEGGAIDLGAADALPVLCDLAYAAADLAARGRSRAVVRVPVGSDLWELGLERSGSDVLVTLFRGAGVPDVAFHERRLDVEVLATALLGALDEVQGGASSGDARVACAREALAASLPFVPVAIEEPALVSVEPTGEVPIVIAADVLLRGPVAPQGSQPVVLRADLLSLLFRGRVRVTVGEHARELPDVFVFLLAEQLAIVALEALEARRRGRPYYRRLTVGGALCGIRLGSAEVPVDPRLPSMRAESADPRLPSIRAANAELGPASNASGDRAAASLTIGVPRLPQQARAQTWTFPAVDIGTLAQGIVAFGRALARSVVRRDRAQASNLRLHAFRARIRELSERLREVTRDDSKINDSPESYRAFAAAVRAPAPAPDTFGRSRLQFTARWMAAVPSIDLHATFLCGDRIVLGATREISCVDGRTGYVLWKKSAPRAVTVLTPLGLARLLPDGDLLLHDIESGDVTWQTRLAPRVGSSASGAVVSAPGLPRTLIVSEGARHLAAVDLHTGEVRWRHAARRSGVFRLRRAGKLLVVASGEPALTALDVLTGDVVWRFCDRLRFASHVAVDQDALFALAGDGAFVARGGTCLHHLDPWSGAARWSVDLPPHAAPVGAPLLAPETVIVPTSGRGGTGLVGFDRRTGATRFEQNVCSSAASCLIVDDSVIVNSEGGELLSVDAATGATRYRHVFGAADGDRPRRLEPVLRSGALFIPQSELHVVRPRDGTLLGKVPGDLIPDLFRVDERCDVYVVEESGNVAAYAAAPRLTLVK